MLEQNEMLFEERLIMTIHVAVDRQNKRELIGSRGRVIMIPFSGTVEGEIFNGTVCPGACDTQTENMAMVRHMSARYMLEGVDCFGQKGRIYIENNGWFTNGERPKPFTTVPTFYTDCEGLAAYLHTSQFITRGFPGEQGPDICVYQLICQTKGKGACESYK